MWWLFFSWLIGACVCLWVVGQLWDEGGEEMDKPWDKR